MRKFSNQRAGRRCIFKTTLFMHTRLHYLCTLNITLNFTFNVFIIINFKKLGKNRHPSSIYNTSRSHKQLVNAVSENLPRWSPLSCPSTNLRNWSRSSWVHFVPKSGDYLNKNDLTNLFTYC